MEQRFPPLFCLFLSWCLPVTTQKKRNKEICKNRDEVSKHRGVGNSQQPIFPTETENSTRVVRINFVRHLGEKSLKKFTATKWWEAVLHNYLPLLYACHSLMVVLKTVAHFLSVGPESLILGGAEETFLAKDCICLFSSTLGLLKGPTQAFSLCFSSLGTHLGWKSTRNSSKTS